MNDPSKTHVEHYQMYVESNRKHGSVLFFLNTFEIHITEILVEKFTLQVSPFLYTWMTTDLFHGDEKTSDFKGKLNM